MIVVTFSFLSLYLVVPAYYDYEKKQENIFLAGKLESFLAGKELDEQTVSKLAESTRKNNVDVFIFNQEKKLIYPLLFQISAEDNTESLDLQSLLGEETGDESDMVFFEELMQQNGLYYTTKGQVKLSNNQPATVFTSTPMQPISDAKRIFIKIYPYFLLVSCVIGIIGAWIYSYFSTRQITQMIKTTAAMTHLSGNQLNQIKGKDELSALSRNINYLYLSLGKMIERLDEENEKVTDLERSKTEFMRIASHELKTPITALSGLIDGMIYEVGEFKDRDKYLLKCREIVDEQTKLVKEILYISQLDLEESTEHHKWFDLRDQISLDSATYEILAKKKIISFQDTIEDLKVYGNELDFKRIFQNVLSNALKYTKEKGEILLRSGDNQLIIENSCVPIPAEEAEQLFAAFSRPDFARSRKDGGNGLGLFIVRQLAERNQWTCSLVPKPDGSGMRFILNFKQGGERTGK